MGILLLLLVGLWVAAVCLLGVSGIATLVRAICQLAGLRMAILRPPTAMC